MAPTILFEDTHLLVLSKPAGLLSQGEISGDENLVDWCRAHFGRNYVGLVHRLDRNTSGLMVVAKRSKSAERLTQALQSGNLVRTYRALLVGELKSKQVWKHYLKKNEASNTTTVVRGPGAGVKEAKLEVFPLRHYADGNERVTLAEFVLDTGRSHQIRVQAAASGFPLVGDAKYDQGRGIAFSRPALHSAKIRFPHPMSKEEMEFSDALPEDLNRFLGRFRASV